MNRSLVVGFLFLVAVGGDSVHAASVTDAIPMTSAASVDRGGSGHVTIDVTGIPSMDRLRSPNNFVMFVWVGPFNVVNGIGYDVFLQTLVHSSRLGDMGVLITNSANAVGTGFGVIPGILDQVPGGPTQYIRPVSDLSPTTRTVTALEDGLVRIEFFDATDEAVGAADGLWVSGTITLQTLSSVPSVGTASLAMLACIASSRRRRDD